jgi:hypothetical protein
MKIWLDEEEEDERSDIREELSKNLSDSLEHIRRAIEDQVIKTKLESIWKAYSRVELTIGLAKLLGNDRSFKTGTFRNPDFRGGKSNSLDPATLNRNLNDTITMIAQSATSFKQDRIVQGIEQARAARDSLKFVLLIYDKPNNSKEDKSRGKALTKKARHGVPQGAIC